jgi:hypothetical protein
MSFPVFHEFDDDGKIRTNELHWEGFPRLAWEALSAAGYLTPPDLRGVRVWALWRPPLQSDCHCSATPGPRWLVRLEFYLMGIHHSRGRWVSRPQSADRLLWPQPHSGCSLSVWIVSCCESSQPSMVGPNGSPTGAVDTSRAVGCYSDASSLSERGLHTSGAAL